MCFLVEDLMVIGVSVTWLLIFFFPQHQVELYNRAFVLTRNTHYSYQNSMGAHQRLGTRCELGEAWSQKQDLENTRHLPTSRH